MQHELRVAICHSITRRAHLAGAEEGIAARRRYWRDLAAVQTLMGQRWEAAEDLGVEP